MRANLPQEVPHLQIAGYVILPEMQKLPENQKFPQGVFSSQTYFISNKNMQQFSSFRYCLYKISICCFLKRFKTTEPGATNSNAG
jgi:hypothetical protein